MTTSNADIPKDAICHEHLIMGCTFNHAAHPNPKDPQADIREVLYYHPDLQVMFERYTHDDSDPQAEIEKVIDVILKIFQAREQQLLTELYEQRWIVSLEPGVSKAVISANDIKERLINAITLDNSDPPTQKLDKSAQNKTNDGGSDGASE